MKKHIKLIYVAIAITGLSVFYGFKQYKPLVNPERDQYLVEALRFILQNRHYEPKNINDDFSEGVFELFIEDLDPYKRYFLEKDIAKFKKYYHDIDNQILRRKFTFFNEVLETYKKRLATSEKLYQEILAEPFDYTKKENIDLDPEYVDYAYSTKEHRNIWRRHLKFSTLNKLTDYLDEEKSKVKDDETYVQTSLNELEKNAREKTLENIKDLFYYENKITDEERFEVFLNCITAQFDPHTTYFGPKMMKRFQSNMAGSIEGIGAQLSDQRGYTKVIKLIPGGPAYKQGDLEVGDFIVKVAQTEEKPVDIVGMRLSDAIELIKGKKGTTVILTVKKVDNTYKDISIVRDIVEFEETFVKSSVTEIDGRKYGIIHLPKFYEDFSKDEKSNCAIDMRDEIEILKHEDVEGLVIDLRNNGGGSLGAVVDIAGLFIKNGPVVQVKQKNYAPLILSDKDNSVVWNGPLVIMVNELSASASEILAAAMQDYRRAIIMGSKQTYGKGTVQSLVDINQNFNFSENLGAIKLTYQKFYRINGGSTQLAGVRSDVIMPDRYLYLNIAEKELDNPLNWDKIEQAKYYEQDYYSNIFEVISEMQNSIDNDPKFNEINNYAKWLKTSQDKFKYSLNLKTFLNEQEKVKEESKKYKEVLKFDAINDFTFPVYEQEMIKSDTILKDRRESWHKTLNKDIYVNKAIDALSKLELPFE